MKHKSYTTKTEITYTDFDFSDVYKATYFPAEYAEEIKNAEILIIPALEENDSSIFPECTGALYRYVSSSDTFKGKIEIAASDEKYREIELHSALLWLGKFMFNHVAIPLFEDFINSYVKEKYGKHAIDNDPTIKTSIIIADDHTEFYYEGPSSGLNAAIDAMLEAMTKARKHDN